MLNKNTKDSKDFILFVFICIKFITGKLINSDRKQVNSFLRSRVERTELERRQKVMETL